jgi:phage gpG-like protein
MAVTFINHCPDALDGIAAAKAKALERIGGKAESYAKKICPVKTGRLRNSITHQQYDDSTEVVGTNVEYAPYVELGHRTSGGKHVAGKPFLRPAAENHTAEYRSIIEHAMKNA